MNMYIHHRLLAIIPSNRLVHLMVDDRLQVGHEHVKHWLRPCFPQQVQKVLDLLQVRLLLDLVFPVFCRTLRIR